MAQQKTPVKFFTLAAWVGLMGALLASWLAPKVISWYFDPPVNIGVNCKAATEWSMHKLQVAQLVGLIVGMIAGLVMGYMILRSRDSDDGTLLK